MTTPCLYILKGLKKRKIYAELQIRGGTEDNSKIVSLIFQRKHMLTYIEISVSSFFGLYQKLKSKY